MANVIDNEDGRSFLDPNSLEAKVTEYVRSKALAKTLETRLKELNKELQETVALDGYEDNDGNMVLDLPFVADGFSRLEKQRRAKRVLDTDAADALISELGLENEVYEMVRTINEDALMAAYYENKITEEQLDSMFPTTVTWAFWTKK